MTQSLPNKEAEDSSDQLEEQGDWSLRANGDTYRDRTDETEILTNRLMRATASVTGIAGQRGAGKSSLALRALDNCAREGAFTQLIHSPTGYDSREFLVSIFQRVCEEVIARVDRKFGEANLLDERGNAERRRLRGIFWVWLLSVFFLIGGVPIYFTYQITEESEQARIKWAENYLEKLDKDENNLSNQLQMLRSKTRLSSSDRNRVRELRMRLRSILRQRENLVYESKYSGTDYIVFQSVILSVTLLILFIFLIFLIHRLRRIRRQWRNAKKFPHETGLRQLALELSEHLTFQTTHSKSIETGLWLSQLTSRFSAGKSLETRPLSLPGLTAQFAQFLERIGEVYSGRVVICLDELDKIENPRELDELLRGIKGVLGQPSTHFILTVSEDALAGFARRRLERGMLESAFEDIILLDRVNLEVAEYVINLMCPDSNRKNGKETIHPSTSLLWLFGNAIPREIKRNVLICLEADRHPRNLSPSFVWNLLFHSRMKDMQSWASRVGGDDKITHEFLVCLEKSIRLLGMGKITNYDHEFGKNIIDLWMGKFKELVLLTPKEDDYSIAIGRAVIEILLGASALVYALKDHPKVLSDHLIEQLLKILEFTPSNLAFAGNLTKVYLSEIDMLEIVEEANQD